MFGCGLGNDLRQHDIRQRDLLQHVTWALSLRFNPGLGSHGVGPVRVLDSPFLDIPDSYFQDCSVRKLGGHGLGSQRVGKSCFGRLRVRSLVCALLFNEVHTSSVLIATA